MVAKECRWRLSTIKQSYDGHMDKMLTELDELERLAKIGKATESALSENNSILILSIQIVADDEYEIEFKSTDELIEWAEQEGKNV